MLSSIEAKSLIIGIITRKFAVSEENCGCECCSVLSLTLHRNAVHEEGYGFSVFWLNGSPTAHSFLSL